MRSPVDRCRQTGFSYMELLLVIAISALIITAVQLASNDHERLMAEAERILALQDELASEAIFDGAPRAMVFEQGFYGFEKRGQNGWQPIEQKPFAKRTIAGPIRLATKNNCSVKGQKALPEQMRVLLLPDGQRSPYTLDLCDGDAVIRIKGNLTHAALEVLPAT